jgi:SET domain-containing protein
MTIFIDISEGKGLGVFASKEFKKGEIIETCPVTVFSSEDRKKIDNTALTHYQFSWGENEDQGAICFGYGSLYNHSHYPNAEFDTDMEERKIIFKAIKDILKGEEICIDYNWELDDPTVPDWFKNTHPDKINKSE